MNDSEQNGVPTEASGPVMSEYERQRQAYRRERARSRRVRLLVRAALLLVLVVAAYAVAGYVALVHLPPEIARLEREVAASGQAVQADRADLALFRSIRAKSGLDAAGKDPAKRLAALVQITRLPGFQDLQRRGGLAALPELPRTQARLAALRRELQQKKNRVQMLDREFEGPVGKGSAAWQQKMQKAARERDAAAESVKAAESQLDRQVKTAMDALAAFEKSLSAPEAPSPGAERLERLRMWRGRLLVWPLSCLDRTSKSGES